MKPLVIYHADCTDGFGAAFAAWLKLGDEAEYLPMHYGNVIKADGLDFTDVYILDFSFPRPVMNELFRVAKRVVWLDHHKTAFEAFGLDPNKRFVEAIPDVGHTPFQGAHYTVLDNNKSGALLAWEYFHPGKEVPLFIKHIDDRDRWQFKIDGSKEFHAAMSSYRPWSFEQWRDMLLHEPYPVDVHQLLAEGAAILRAQEQHVQQMVGHARKCRIVGGVVGYEVGPFGDVDVFEHFDGLAVNASLHQSEVGHVLATRSGTYGLVWYLGDDAMVRCSLRSNGDYDVSAIARCLGGGGHRNAAGFSCTADQLLRWLT